jgi:dipeptidyl aminopeptidase/acylaminoacyl peptidase
MAEELLDVSTPEGRRDAVLLHGVKPAQLAGISTDELEAVYGLALEDTGASPTLYTGNEEGEVYSLQDDGATHTLLASGLGEIRGMAFSAPNRTLYLASYDRREVYALQVDTRATATVTLDPPLSPNYHPWGVALSRDGRTLSVTQHQLPPPP